MATGHFLAFVCATSVVCSCLLPISAASEEQDDYAMFVSFDETKVSIISGNFTVAVTRDWPRMVFQHSDDPFSPTFDIGFPKLYLFNDTDGDGRFCRSEAVYTVFLDSNHVDWNLSSVHPGFTSGLGEFVMFSMSARADAYNATPDAPPSVESWANLTFWFCLAENMVDYENPMGTHTVSGKVQMFVNMTVDVMNRTAFECIAIERSIQGGGTTNMFYVLEDGPDGEVAAVLSARVDESLDRDNVTRPLNMTESSTQCIDMAKEDGTVQAFYRWGSAAADLSTNSSAMVVNSSCFTTGTGLVLYSTLPLSNGTLVFSLDSSLGIDEGGFVGSVTDWVKELGLAVAVAVVAATVAIVAILHVMMRRRRLRRESFEGKKSGEDP